MCEPLAFLYCKNLLNNSKVIVKSTDLWILKQETRATWSKCPLVINNIDEFRSSLKLPSYLVQKKVDYGLVQNDIMVKHAVLEVAESEEILIQKMNEHRVGTGRRFSIDESFIPLKSFIDCPPQNPVHVSTTASSESTEGPQDTNPSKESEVQVFGEGVATENAKQCTLHAGETTPEALQNDQPESSLGSSVGHSHSHYSKVCETVDWSSLLALQHAADREEAFQFICVPKSRIYVGLGLSVRKQCVINAWNPEDSFEKRAEKIFNLICSDGLHKYTVKEHCKKLKFLPKIFRDSVLVILQAMPQSSKCKEITPQMMEEFCLRQPRLVRQRVMAEKEDRKAEFLLTDDSYDSSEISFSDSD